MTILLLSDWKKHPNAIIHTSTANKSWLDLATAFKGYGALKNHAFFLALHNPELEHIDPHNPYLTVEQKVAVLIEARNNLWYFLRECVRVTTFDGSDKSLDANTGNIAAWWSWMVGLDVGWQQIRQTTQTTSIMALYSWLIAVRFTTSNLLWGNRDDATMRACVLGFDQMLKNLPPYFDQRNAEDLALADHRAEYPQIKISLSCNQIVFPVAQATEKRAYNHGRGFTGRVLVIDDMQYFMHGAVSLASFMGSVGMARMRARESADADPAGLIILATAGKKSTPEGKYTLELFEKLAPWTELLYDSVSRSCTRYR
jgi:hypothetical protein